jgi:hypothetical protein
MEVKQHSGLKNREKETGLDFRRYKGKKKNCPQGSPSLHSSSQFG